MAEDDLETLLRVFTRLHIGYIRHELERRGVGDAAHPPTLLMLYHAQDRPMTQREIARALGISPPTVTMSVKRMEKAGLVCKQNNEADLRKSCITLTEEGRRCAGTIVELHQDLNRQLLTGFSRREADQLTDFCRRMIQNLHHPGCRRPDLPDDLRRDKSSS